MTEKSAVKIMVLDDDPFMLKLFSRMLTNMGLNSVIVCDNGNAALAWFSASDQHPSIILLDLNMPEMDGVEFLRRLFEHHYTGSIILISEEDERTLQIAHKLALIYKFEVLGMLHKPITMGGLKSLLEKWVPILPCCMPKVAELQYSAAELRAAIDNGELTNYYQPKVEVATGRVIGVETLVRWQHPRDGMVFPGQFIATAEAHGLINDLTRVVLRAALVQAGCWLEMGITLRMSVNISMDNLASLDFADFVAEVADATGVPPPQVVLEVTESQLMHDPRTQLEILARLRLKRFRLSIDDFGTGYSTLSQLRDIPFDELKIDQSFVHGACDDGMTRAMFDASLNLAKQLNMEIVAEGIENQADWDFLFKTECDIAQGYFIAKPMHAAALPGWMSGWEKRIQEGFSIAS